MDKKNPNRESRIRRRLRAEAAAMLGVKEPPEMKSVLPPELQH
jgi:hypothetical protein